MSALKLNRKPLFILGLGLTLLCLSGCSLIPGAAPATVVVATQVATAAPAKLAATATKQVVGTATKAPTAAPSATPGVKQPTATTAAGTAEQFGLLADLKDKVSIKPAGSASAHAGLFGEALPKGAVLTTDTTGQARIILQNGTTVRLASNSQLSLSDRQQAQDGSILSQFSLVVGKIWAILGRGGNETLTVETPIGVGAVRGSYLSVEYIPGKADDPSDDILIITCLEGDCSLTTPLGTINLTTGQKITITGKGNPPVGPSPLTQQDIQDWLDNNVDILVLFGVTDGQLPESNGPVTIQIPGGGTFFILPTPTAQPGGSTLPTVAPAAGVPWPASGANGIGAFAVVFGGVALSVVGRSFRKRPK